MPYAVYPPGKAYRVTFESLIGNRTLVSRLVRMAEADRVPPSLLFTGPVGVGKLQTALALARAVNCLNEPGTGCGECSACLRIGKGEHPDVHIARPEGAGRQMRADVIRQIVSDAPFRPFEGRRRVSIFVDAERMNPTAANILLKTLEEPPPWAILILITSNAAALLPTILSRCQVYRFAPLAIDDVTEELVSRHGMDRERATLVAALSGGSLEKALELEDEALIELRQTALSIARVVVDGASERDMVSRADTLSKHDQLFMLLQLLVGIARDVATRHAGGRIVHQDLEKEIHRLAEGAPLSLWIRAHELAEGALEDLRDRYLNKRITVSRLLAEFATLRLPATSR